MVSAALGRSVVLRILPQNASSVHSRSSVPGVTFRTGPAPERERVLRTLRAELDNLHRGLPLLLSSRPAQLAPGGRSDACDRLSSLMLATPSNCRVRVTSPARMAIARC